jgi:hypothetical protein
MGNVTEARTMPTDTATERQPRSHLPRPLGATGQDDHIEDENTRLIVREGKQERSRSRVMHVNNKIWLCLENYAKLCTVHVEIR